MERVFVYGTLKRDQGNHRVMEWAGGNFLGEAETSPGYTMYGSGIPIVQEDDSHRTVKGEVYDVETLNPLDDLEGHPHFYCRERRIIPRYGWCWIYMQNHWQLSDHAMIIEDGEWW